jgi:hypothetical protein
MDLVGDPAGDPDKDEAGAGAEAEAERRGAPKEHTLRSTHHPSTMEATSTKNWPTRTKSTTSKEPRAQDGKEEEDEGIKGGGENNERTR